MALRNIVEKGDGVLAKKCREVTAFDAKLCTLIDDMRETLIKADGVGLAAPQVGILRRLVLVVETNTENPYIIELINPEITEMRGTQSGPEGCLSIPGVFGWVTRPMYVKVKAQDREGKEFEVEGEGLTARAFCHEIDHLNGILFDSVADHIMSEEELDEYYGRKR